MRVPLPDIEPVAMMIEEIETTGDLRFTGVDLGNGARVTVAIERTPSDRPAGADVCKPTQALILVLTMETLDSLN